jgi:hypothetical protein
MRQFQRPTLWALALLVSIEVGGEAAKPVFAQEPTTGDLSHCGPADVLPGSLVSLNVGNVGPASQSPGVFQLRLLDPNGNPLLDRSLTLLPGQARAASLRMPREGLVRGEVLVVSGPDDLQFRATMQVLVPTEVRGLTYGPNFECSGPTGHRGPV